MLSPHHTQFVIIWKSGTLLLAGLGLSLPSYPPLHSRVPLEVPVSLAPCDPCASCLAAVSEEQCLYQIYIDELYGGLQRPSEDEKKK